MSGIDDDAFFSCSGLTSATISSGVTSIDEQTFYDCSGLNEIIIRNPGLNGNVNLTTGNNATVYYGADQNMVTFVINCDTSIDDRLVGFGVATAEPTVLTKEHILLRGWYIDADENKKFDFNTSITEFTLFLAKWTINKYNVIFDSDGGNVVTPQRNVEYNTLLMVLENPTCAGYNFLDWYNGDETYDFTILVSADITLTAKWEAIPVKTNSET